MADSRGHFVTISEPYEDGVARFCALRSSVAKREKVVFTRTKSWGRAGAVGMVATLLSAVSPTGEADAVKAPPNTATTVATEWEYTPAATAASDDVELVRVETQGDNLSVSTITMASPEAAARYEARAELDSNVTVEPVIWRHSHSPNDSASEPLAIDPANEGQWNIFNMGPRVTGTGTGNGRTVAVLDAGIKVGVSAAIDRRVVGRANFSDSVAPSLSNHAAKVADVVLQVAPDVNLLDVKIGDDHGFESDQIIKGIKWAVDNGANVLNLSLGGSVSSSGEKAAIDWAVARGVVVVASSGNDGPASPPFYPARYENVIAVGALDQNNFVTNFSSPGRHVDIWAPGSNVPVLGRTTTATGTSFAAPHVAGLAALVQETNPTWTPEHVQAAIEVEKGTGVTLAAQPDGFTQKWPGVARFASAATPDGEIPTVVPSVTSDFKEDLVFQGRPGLNGMIYEVLCGPGCTSYGRLSYNADGNIVPTWFGVRGTDSPIGLAVQVRIYSEDRSQILFTTRPRIVRSYPEVPTAPTLQSIRQSSVGLAIAASVSVDASSHRYVSRILGPLG
jgi:subtilisin family serine protease